MKPEQFKKLTMAAQSGWELLERLDREGFRLSEDERCALALLCEWAPKFIDEFAAYERRCRNYEGEPDKLSLHGLRQLAGQAGVSFEIQYSECEDNWWGEVSSAAPSERQFWKKHGRVSDLVTAMGDWMRKLTER